MKNFLLKLSRVFLLTVFINGVMGYHAYAQTKLELSTDMISLVDGSGGDPTKLVDEQVIAGDPADGSGGAPSTMWEEWSNSSNHAIIDLGKEYNITKIYLYDLSGDGNFSVASGSVDNWDVLFTDPLMGYGVWNEHLVGVTTRYVKVNYLVNAGRVGEIVIYGEEAEEDITAPAAITDLAIKSVKGTSITIGWTSVGDNGNIGTATSYDCRYSTSQIDESNFISASLFSLGNPQIAGTNETANITGLNTETNYYVAIKAIDEKGNTAPISNVVSGTTTDEQTPLIDYPTLGPKDDGLKINYSESLHPTTSYIVATCRNHVEDGYNGNLEARFEKYNTIKPQFGQQRKLYRIGHGPWDGRLDPPNDTYMFGYHFEDKWGFKGSSSYPYDDIRYALADAAKLDADISMVVNYGTGTPEEAGRLVNYVNHPDNTVRKSHGLEPWGVKYFEIGNELPWNMVRGHDEYAKTPEMYGKRANLFAKEMRKNSPTPIKIGAVASINFSWWGNDWPNTEPNGHIDNIDSILRYMGNETDFLIFHMYPGWPLKAKHSNPTWREHVMGATQWAYNKLTKSVMPTIERCRVKYDITREITVANTEYFSDDYEGGMDNMVLEALYTADNMIMALQLNFDMAVNFCFAHQSVGDNLFFYNNDAEQTTAVFDIHKFVAENLGDQVIGSSSYGIPQKKIDTEQGAFSYKKLAFITTKKANGDVVMLIVNRTEEEITMPIDPGFGVAAATLETYHGAKLSNNTMVHETNDMFDLHNVIFKPASVNILTLTSDGTIDIKDKTGAINNIDFNVFPNPFSEYFHIQINNITETTVLSVYDMAGNKIMTKQYDAISSVSDDINVSRLARGVYVVEVSSKNGSSLKKVVKL